MLREELDEIYEEDEEIEESFDDEEEIIDIEEDEHVESLETIKKRIEKNGFLW